MPPPHWDPVITNQSNKTVLSRPKEVSASSVRNRAIFAWPWNENRRTKQKQQTHGNKANWLVYRTDTNARGFWLVIMVKRTLGWKNVMPENFLEINRYFSLTSCCNTNGSFEQYLLHIRVFFGCFGGKTKSPCFDLFIHWLIKQITNAYRNHFSRSSYENRSSGSLFPSNISNFRISGVSVIASVRPAFTRLTVPESGAPPGPEAWTGRASPRKPL